MSLPASSDTGAQSLPSRSDAVVAALRALSSSTRKGGGGELEDRTTLVERAADAIANAAEVTLEQLAQLVQFRGDPSPSARRAVAVALDRVARRGGACAHAVIPALAAMTHDRSAPVARRALLAVDASMRGVLNDAAHSASAALMAAVDAIGEAVASAASLADNVDASGTVRAAALQVLETAVYVGSPTTTPDSVATALKTRTSTGFTTPHAIGSLRFDDAHVLMANTGFTLDSVPAESRDAGALRGGLKRDALSRAARDALTLMCGILGSNATTRALADASDGGAGVSLQSLQNPHTMTFYGDLLSRLANIAYARPGATATVAAALARFANSPPRHLCEVADSPSRMPPALLGALRAAIARVLSSPVGARDATELLSALSAAERDAASTAAAAPSGGAISPAIAPPLGPNFSVSSVYSSVSVDSGAAGQVVPTLGEVHVEAPVAASAPFIGSEMRLEAGTIQASAPDGGTSSTTNRFSATAIRAQGIGAIVDTVMANLCNLPKPPSTWRVDESGALDRLLEAVLAVMRAGHVDLEDDDDVGTLAFIDGDVEGVAPSLEAAVASTPPPTATYGDIRATSTTDRDAANGEAQRGVPVMGSVDADAGSDDGSIVNGYATDDVGEPHVEGDRRGVTGIDASQALQTVPLPPHGVGIRRLEDHPAVAHWILPRPDGDQLEGGDTFRVSASYDSSAVVNAAVARVASFAAAQLGVHLAATVDGDADRVDAGAHAAGQLQGPRPSRTAVAPGAVSRVIRACVGGGWAAATDRMLALLELNSRYSMSSHDGGSTCTNGARSAIEALCEAVVPAPQLNTSGEESATGIVPLAPRAFVRLQRMLTVVVTSMYYSESYGAVDGGVAWAPVIEDAPVSVLSALGNASRNSDEDSPHVTAEGSNLGEHAASGNLAGNLGDGASAAPNRKRARGADALSISGSGVASSTVEREESAQVSGVEQPMHGEDGAAVYGVDRDMMPPYAHAVVRAVHTMTELAVAALGENASDESGVVNESRASEASPGAALAAFILDVPALPPSALDGFVAICTDFHAGAVSVRAVLYGRAGVSTRPTNATSAAQTPEGIGIGCLRDIALYRPRLRAAAVDSLCAVAVCDGPVDAARRLARLVLVRRLASLTLSAVAEPFIEVPSAGNTGALVTIGSRVIEFARRLLQTVVADGGSCYGRGTAPVDLSEAGAQNAKRARVDEQSVVATKGADLAGIAAIDGHAATRATDGGVDASGSHESGEGGASDGWLLDGVGAGVEMCAKLPDLIELGRGVSGNAAARVALASRAAALWIALCAATPSLLPELVQTYAVEAARTAAAAGHAADAVDLASADTAAPAGAGASSPVLVVMRTELAPLLRGLCKASAARGGGPADVLRALTQHMPDHALGASSSGPGTPACRVPAAALPLLHAAMLALLEEVGVGGSAAPALATESADVHTTTTATAAGGRVTTAGTTQGSTSITVLKTGAQLLSADIRLAALLATVRTVEVDPQSSIVRVAGGLPLAIAAISPAAALLSPYELRDALHSCTLTPGSSATAVLRLLSRALATPHVAPPMSPEDMLVAVLEAGDAMLDAQEAHVHVQPSAEASTIPQVAVPGGVLATTPRSHERLRYLQELIAALFGVPLAGAPRLPAPATLPHTARLSALARAGERAAAAWSGTDLRPSGGPPPGRQPALPTLFMLAAAHTAAAPDGRPALTAVLRATLARLGGAAFEPIEPNLRNWAIGAPGANAGAPLWDGFVRVLKALLGGGYTAAFEVLLSLPPEHLSLLLCGAAGKREGVLRDRALAWWAAQEKARSAPTSTPTPSYVATVMSVAAADAAALRATNNASQVPPAASMS